MSKDIKAVLRCPSLEAATVFRESLMHFHGIVQYTFYLNCEVIVVLTKDT